MILTSSGETELFAWRDDPEERTNLGHDGARPGGCRHVDANDPRDGSRRRREMSGAAERSGGVSGYALAAGATAITWTAIVGLLMEASERWSRLTASFTPPSPEA
jgi:hypothetical protein